MAEPFQLYIFPSEPREITPEPPKKKEKKRLTPEQKKNIKYFWKDWEYKTVPDAVLGEVPYLITEDIDPQEKIAKEWRAFRSAEKYEGRPQYLPEQVRAELDLKDMETVPVGKFYPNLKPIPEDSKLVLIEDPKSKQLIWYFAEPVNEKLTDLREFPADYIKEFSTLFPKEIKKAIEEAEKEVMDK